jgi:hypothetical protein
MSNDFIGVDVRGLDILAKLLRDLPDEVQDTVIDDVSEYLLNVLKINAQQNYVTRKAAYGVSFFTPKQRRWFFAALADGKINVPYHRTQALAAGWKQVGRGRNSILANEAKGADWVVGENQSRHERMVGWKTVTQTIIDRQEQIQRKADAAAQKAIKKLGG